MNFVTKHISLLKCCLFLLAVIGMLSQMCVNTLALYGDYNLEIVETNADDDSDKEEKIERDAETKKNELQATIEHTYIFSNSLKMENFKILHYLSKFSLKIPLPPPDMA